jgi:hypothetical protein
MWGKGYSRGAGVLVGAAIALSAASGAQPNVMSANKMIHPIGNHHF